MEANKHAPVGRVPESGGVDAVVPVIGTGQRAGSVHWQQSDKEARYRHADLCKRTKKIETKKAPKSKVPDGRCENKVSEFFFYPLCLLDGFTILWAYRSALGS